MRQTVAFQTLPSRSFIGGLEQSAAWAAALSPIGVNLELPHSRKQSPRIVGIHTHVRAAGVFIHKQHFLPVFPAIGGAEYTAIRLRSIGVAQGASQHDVRVMRVNHDIPDSSGLFQPHQLPGLPRVQRFVNPAADGNVASDKRLTGSRPHDIRIRRRDRERANRRDFLIIEDGRPVDSGIDGLPDPSRRRAGVALCCAPEGNAKSGQQNPKLRSSLPAVALSCRIRN